MKRILIPLSIAILGIVLFGFSFMNIGSSSGEVDIDIVKTKHIMPMAHNVYSNKDVLDGKYYLFKAKITNNTGKTLEDVTVRYQIPGYVEWTELTIIGEMFKGQTAVVSCYPKFNENIAEKTTESNENVDIEITWDGAKEDDVIEEGFSFRMTDRNEYMFTNLPADEIAGWSDVYDNDALLACHVTPNDPIVKYYTQNIQEKILKGETASVTKTPEEAVRFLAGIYNATIQSGMVYSGTKGIPETLTDMSSMSQHNRLPREVITGNTGLCLELSLLYASVLSAGGLDPFIFLVPGHAYPGFRLNGEFYAIESTGIGGEGIGGSMTAEEAFKKGQEQLGKFIEMAQNGDPRYNLVDIHQVNQQGVTPMNLKDDSFLRQKVDDLVANWGTQKKISKRVVSNSGGSSAGGSTGGGSSTRRTSGLSFSIPQGWQTIMRPVPEMPIMTAQVMAPDGITNATIYDIPAQNMNQAMQVIQNYFVNFGMSMDYQMQGNSVSGITYSSAGNYNWIGKALQTSNGIRFVAVGAPDYAFQQNSGIINQVFNSIR